MEQDHDILLLNEGQQVLSCHPKVDSCTLA